MTLSVEQAETALATARTEEAKQKRENAKQEIQRLAAEGAALRTELQALTAQINEAQSTRLKLNGLLVQARNNIAAYSVPLDPLDFPTAQEEADRVGQLAASQQSQGELLAQHRAAVDRESVRPYAVQLQQRLLRMQYEIRNLTAIAEGRRPGQLAEGGLFPVEDFLGHSQVGPPRHM